MPSGKGEVPVLVKFAYGTPNQAETIQVPKVMNAERNRVKCG